MEAASVPPAQQQPPPQQPPDAAAIAALTLLLLHAGTAVAAGSTLEAATSLLGQLGISPAAVAAIWPDVASFTLSPQSDGAAGSWVRRTSAARRAAYALNAARRLDAAGVTPEAVDAEHRHMGQHDLAEAKRQVAAQAVDEASARHGLTLGWYARMDDRTTPGCRAANGQNFDARRPPTIEGSPAYPGQPHGGTCRCRPGPPHPGGTLLP
jgi:hypothetical protein